MKIADRGPHKEHCGHKGTTADRIKEHCRPQWSGAQTTHSLIQVTADRRK